MSVDEVKAIYLAMRESGDLTTLFPELSGEWLKDKKTFTFQYEDNERALEDGLDFEEYEDDLGMYQ